MNLTWNEWNNHSHELWRSLEKVLLFQLNPEKPESISKFYLSIESEVHFFLQVAEKVYWKKVFSTALRLEDLIRINEDYEKIKKILNQPFSPLILFPAIQDGDMTHLAVLSGYPKCFRYSVIRDEKKWGIELYEWKSEREMEGLIPESSHAAAVQEADSCEKTHRLFKGRASFFWAGRLQRDELVDLMALFSEVSPPSGGV
ncbi:MAG: hypothetical protein A2Z83_02260 [Omnitrophica bacterium GWA2_52_8]|nr:MAG: hypothetical protein A2Z83_02260 [Omnitrophica bacterium GWA2_52_8]